MERYQDLHLAWGGDESNAKPHSRQICSHINDKAMLIIFIPLPCQVLSNVNFGRHGNMHLFDKFCFPHLHLRIRVITLICNKLFKSCLWKVSLPSAINITFEYIEIYACRGSPPESILTSTRKIKNQTREHIEFCAAIPCKLKTHYAKKTTSELTTHSLVSLVG